MIYILSSLYFLYGFILFYTYFKGYSLLRYLLKRKNINVVLSIELIFIIFASTIVFTSQPLNWIVALIMFTHVAGVIWLITNPDGYYSTIDTNSVDMDSLETASAMIVIAYGVFVYSSKLFLG
jgi:cation transport ATPase